MHPTISKIAAGLREAGLPTAPPTHPGIHGSLASFAHDDIRVLDDDVRTAAAAAAALGVPVGAIANSLVFRAISDDESTPLLALTSGAHRADLATLAALAGADRVAMADPAFVREHTGQAIGGVAPIGHPHPIATLVDTQLADHPVVWAAAGHPKAVFPTTFADLVALTGGRAAEVGA